MHLEKVRGKGRSSSGQASERLDTAMVLPNKTKVDVKHVLEEK
jgi:hypothetical protein